MPSASRDCSVNPYRHSKSSHETISYCYIIHRPPFGPAQLPSLRLVRHRPTEPDCDRLLCIAIVQSYCSLGYHCPLCLPFAPASQRLLASYSLALMPLRMDFTTPSSPGSGSYRNAPRVRRPSGAQMANVPSSHRDTIPSQASTLHQSPPDAGHYHTDGRRQRNSSQYTGESVSSHQYVENNSTQEHTHQHYQQMPRSWGPRNSELTHIVNDPRLQDAIARLSHQNTNTQPLHPLHDSHSSSYSRSSSHSSPAAQHSHNTWPLGHSNLQYLNDHRPQPHPMDRPMSASHRAGPYDAAGYVGWQSDYERPAESRSDQRYVEYDHMSHEEYEVDEEQQYEDRSSATLY
ncbi:hypothetical protein BKA63DRAFT_24335 [Paraphoma chrysanthemicola]|nr:hypothetical protein BKA63DRAFT_24335 [Paraphoma chrysanthemicola]